MSEELSPLGSKMVAGMSSVCDAIEAAAELKAENERLRSALKEIASFSRLEYVGLGELGSKLVRIALLALEAKP